MKYLVTLKDGSGSKMIGNESIINRNHKILEIGSSIRVRLPDKEGNFLAVINQIKTETLYHVIFNDGDRAVLKRKSLRINTDVKQEGRGRNSLQIMKQNNEDNNKIPNQIEPSASKEGNKDSPRQPSKKKIKLEKNVSDISQILKVVNDGNEQSLLNNNNPATLNRNAFVSELSTPSSNEITVQKIQQKLLSEFGEKDYHLAKTCIDNYTEGIPDVMVEIENDDDINTVYNMLCNDISENPDLGGIENVKHLTGALLGMYFLEKYNSLPESVFLPNRYFS